MDFLWRYAVNSSGTTSLVWEDESITQPTDAEIATKLAELTTAWNAKLYQRNRVSLGTTTYPNKPIQTTKTAQTMKTILTVRTDPKRDTPLLFLTSSNTSQTARDRQSQDRLSLCCKRKAPAPELASPPPRARLAVLGKTRHQLVTLVLQTFLKHNYHVRLQGDTKHLTPL